MHQNSAVCGTKRLKPPTNQVKGWTKRLKPPTNQVKGGTKRLKPLTNQVKGCFKTWHTSRRNKK